MNVVPGDLLRLALGGRAIGPTIAAIIDEELAGEDHTLVELVPASDTKESS